MASGYMFSPSEAMCLVQVQVRLLSIVLARGGGEGGELTVPRRIMQLT